MANTLDYGILESINFELNKLAVGYEELHSYVIGKLHKSSSNTPKLFMNNREVMVTCGITSNTLKEWRVRGILKGKKINGIWLYKVADIERLVD